MGSIDADAHVIETAETFTYIEEADKAFTPLVVTQTAGEVQRNTEGAVSKEYWVVDNRVVTKDSNIGSNTTAESREMTDISARLAHMDELGIDVQVLYPTMFLRPLTGNFQIEYAICRSYNRWLADIWKRAPERLRWVAMAPIMSRLDRLRDELQFCKEHGACGIFMRGPEGDCRGSNPALFPLYEMAGELDLAICHHSGNGSIKLHDFYDAGSSFQRFKLAVVGTFHDLVLNEIPARFPDVRWAFIEVSAQWLPYALNDLELRLKRRGRRLPADPLKDNNMWVAAQVTDELDKILECVGTDNLIVGTDYGHHDTATEIEALRKIRDDGKVDAAIVDKILDDNARALYRL